VQHDGLQPFHRPALAAASTLTLLPGSGGLGKRAPQEIYAELAARWREEGAQIVGGCCGTSPAHIAAVRERLEGTKPGRLRGATPPPPDELAAVRARGPWLDEGGRSVYPLRFPELTFDPDVFVPTLGLIGRL
jgi:hypothetical protein